MCQYLSHANGGNYCKAYKGEVDCTSCNCPMLHPELLIKTTEENPKSVEFVRKIVDILDDM